MNITEISGDADTKGAWTFRVDIDEKHSYQVTVPKHYWQQLTAGHVEPRTLVEESFNFLLEREPASQILPEFELPLIQHYFPEYERDIKERLV